MTWNGKIIDKFKIDVQFNPRLYSKGRLCVLWDKISSLIKIIIFKIYRKISRGILFGYKIVLFRDKHLVL